MEHPDFSGDTIRQLTDTKGVFMQYHYTALIQHLLFFSFSRWEYISIEIRQTTYSFPVGDIHMMGLSPTGNCLLSGLCSMDIYPLTGKKQYIETDF